MGILRGGILRGEYLGILRGGILREEEGRLRWNTGRDLEYLEVEYLSGGILRRGT